MNRNLRTALCYLAFAVAVAVAYGAGRMTGMAPQNVSASEHVLFYVDPMHPSYRSDRPGVAPDCGMPLEPVFAGSAAARASYEPTEAVSSDGVLREGPGVTVGIARRESLSRQLRTTGRVAADENASRLIQAGADGWVTSLGNNPVGTVVRKGELLAVFFSYDFLRPQQAYFFALNTLDRVRSSGRDTPEQIQQAQDILRSNEDALRLLGMGDLQIQELAKTRRTAEDILVSSPTNGVVSARNLLRGQSLSRGDELYRIVDLDHVWIFADLLPDQAQAVRPGTKIRITSHDISEPFYTTVRSSLPLFESASRLSKVRLEVANPGLILRPGAFVDIELREETPAVISVPTAAVLDTGLNKILFVQDRAGTFAPRVVQLGRVYQDRVVVVSGLKEGEQVVTSANFFKDSESQLRSIPGG